MSNEFNRLALRQKQSLPLEGKIILTQLRVRKDSTVLKHIVDNMYDDVPAVFVNTGLEYPDIQKFVKDVKAGRFNGFNTDVEIVRPEMRFDDVIDVYGYPVISKEVSNTISGARNSIEKGIYSHRLCKLGVKRDEYGGLYDDGKHDYDAALSGSKFMQTKWRFLLDADFKISSRCCDVMKKRPAALYEKGTGRKPFVATMASESLNRENEWFKNGCNGFNAKKPKSIPMSFWTENDVLQYIVENDLPYASVYGEIVKGENGYFTTGCDRTGCMFCMFGCHREKAPNRFQRMKETHPRQYDYCMRSREEKGLGLREVLDYIGVNYE